MKQKLLVSAISTALLILLAASRSDLVLSRGSDALVTDFRVPIPGLLASMVVWSLLAIFFFMPRSGFRSSMEPAPAGSRPNPPSRHYLGLITVGAIAGLFIVLSSHAIIVGTKRDKAELQEFWGPFEARSFSAESADAPLQAVCKNGFLVVEATPARPWDSHLWLGIGPWTLPSSICQHPLLAIPIPSNSEAKD